MAIDEFQKGKTTRAIKWPLNTSHAAIPLAVECNIKAFSFLSVTDDWHQKVKYVQI